MKKTYLKKISAGFLAAVFIFSDVFCASGADLRRFKSYKSSKIANVIVTVKGEPVLSGEEAEKEGTEYLSTKEADKKESILLSNQSKAKSCIESFYPELKVKYSYTSLLNGFACSLPEELIDDVKSCPYVENVQISESFEKPRLTEETLSASGVDVFCSETDCSGAGESIAVLDTELDSSHKMFAPISEEKSEFSKSDIENYIKSNNLNAELDADKAYISSKIPLAYNYTNYENHYDISAESMAYHGTHVCGIAAGNKVTDDKGRSISGAAPDAQIIFMNVFAHNDEQNSDNANDFDVIAAMEDCVKLGITAINLSFGADYESSSDQAYITACQNAENAGVIVCSAAGNNGVYESPVCNPDTSSLDSPAAFSSVMAVASADNPSDDYIMAESVGNVQISDFSSMGVSENLELKPDITAIGGNVYSAARGNKFEYHSGTSMASPFIAGCCALVSEKMKKDSVNLTGADKTLYIKNLLMNSAVPLTDNNSGRLYSPRLQGAGLVNLENLLNDNVLLTSSDGRAKICLYDKMQDSFSIPLNLKNLSTEDISFSKAELKLFTDDSVKYEWYPFETISGSRDIWFDADLSDLKTVSAGQTKSTEIKVNMDGNQLKKISEKFTNGFFVEGYIMLSGAENCCDISVPIMGYYGNWGNIPIFGNDIYNTSNSYAGSLINGMLFPLGYNWSDDSIKYEDYYISPNDDNIFDSLFVKVNTQRECVNAGIIIYDKNGKIVASSKDNNTEFDLLKGELNEPEGFDNLSELKDGEEYTVRIYGKINYPDAKEQSFTFKIKTDNKPPEIISSDIIKKNGRKIVTLKVKDNGKLEGIEVIGKGKGAIAGENSADNNSINSFREFMRSMQNSDSVYWENNFLMSSDSVGAKTDSGKSLTAEQTEDIDNSDIDFAQKIPANPDENGIFTLEYDVTDMESYDFIIADAAMNITEYNETYKVNPDGSEEPDNKDDSSKPDNKDTSSGNDSEKTDSGKKKTNDNSLENPATGAENGLGICAVILGGIIVSSRRKKKKRRF